MTKFTDPLDKTCSRCKVTKPRSEFTKESRRKDGLNSRCRECTRASQKTPQAVAARRARRQREDIKRKRAEYSAKQRYIKRHGTLEGFSFEYKPLEQLEAERKQRAQEESKRQAERASQRAKLMKEKPWLSSALSNSEAFRLRYRLDPLFMLRERLKRQIVKKLQRDRPEERPSIKAFADILEATSNIEKFESSCSIERIIGYSIEDLLESLVAQFKPGMSLEVPSSWQIDHDTPQRIFNLSDPAQARECWALGNLQPLHQSENVRKAHREDKQFAEMMSKVPQSVAESV